MTQTEDIKSGRKHLWEDGNLAWAANGMQRSPTPEGSQVPCQAEAKGVLAFGSLNKNITKLGDSAITQATTKLPRLD